MATQTLPNQSVLCPSGIGHWWLGICVATYWCTSLKFSALATTKPQCTRCPNSLDSRHIRQTNHSPENFVCQERRILWQQRGCTAEPASRAAVQSFIDHWGSSHYSPVAVEGFGAPDRQSFRADGHILSAWPEPYRPAGNPASDISNPHCAWSDSAEAAAATRLREQQRQQALSDLGETRNTLSRKIWDFH